MFSVNFSKAKSKFCLSLHYTGDNSYLLVDWKEIYKFKDSNGNNNFPTRFFIGSISDRFSVTESREVFLEGNVYVSDFSAVYNAIDKPGILTFSSLASVVNSPNYTKCTSLKNQQSMINLLLFIYILMNMVKDYFTIHSQLT